MKKKISLGGYKAIGEVAKLNLAPITLLIGPNGSVSAPFFELG